MIKEVETIIKTRSEEQTGKGKMYVAIDVDATPAFYAGSKFPVKVQCWTEELWPFIKLGPATIIVEQGNRKGGKDIDGSRDYHYFWNLVGIKGVYEPARLAEEDMDDTTRAKVSHVREQKQAAQEKPAPAKSGYGMDIETQRRVTFLSCLSSAATLYVGLPPSEKPKKVPASLAVLEIAKRFAAEAFAFGRGQRTDTLEDGLPLDDDERGEREDQA